MKKISPRRRRAGFTVPEVMIALFVLSIGMTGCITLVLQAKRLNDKARLHYQAVNICKNRLEHARTLDFAVLPYLVEDDLEVDVFGSPKTEGDFRRSTIVSNVAGVASNLIEVTVTVEIRDRVTRSFEGEGETVRSLFADIWVPPEE